jgi:hypothetical protein
VSGAEIKPPATTTVWFFEFVSCRLRPKNMWKSLISLQLE